MQRIAVVNTSSAKDSDVRTWLSAIQLQVTADFAPIWNREAELHLMSPGESLLPTDWLISIVENSGTVGALGTHWLQDRPTGEVAVKTSLDDGVSVSSVLSHEILEMLADPQAVIGFLVGNEWWALEPCDPVEGRPYKINGVEVEDFCRPSYYLPDSKGPWDFVGRLSKPGQLLDGGYQLVFKADGSWDQRSGRRARSSKLRLGPKSRRASRVSRYLTA